METKNYFAHPTAVIDDGCEIGEGTSIITIVYQYNSRENGKIATPTVIVFLETELPAMF